MAADLRSEFLQVLVSRRRNLQVPLSVEQGSPVEDPVYQGEDPLEPRVAMESCLRKEVESFEEKLVEENFYLITELGEQGRVPVLLLRLNDSTPRRKPAIVFLHSSYKCKEWLRPLLEAYASRDYICVAIDSRYHGERARNKNTYIDALKSAWRNGDTMPFIFDTVWDLIKLGDYLSERGDVDPCRIGITGESLGGMHAWFAAVADTRYSVVVPIIGFQGFRWAIDNNMWRARVNSIKPVFEEARIDSGKSEIDVEVVEKVWDRIAPGLASQFDAPYSIHVIAPRPLLILTGAKDHRCPLAGLHEPASRAVKAYEEVGSAEKFKLLRPDPRCAAHDAARRQVATRTPLAFRALSVFLPAAQPQRGARRGSWVMLRRAMALLALAAAAVWSPRLACVAGAGRGAHVTRRPGCHLSISKSTPSSSSCRPDATATALPGRRMAAAAGGDLSSEYLQVLLSRRRRRNLQVPLSVEQGSPVKAPLYQGNRPLGSREAMESCPRKEVENFRGKLVEENFYLITGSSEQGRVPVLLLRLNDTDPKRKPVIVLLHSSYKCKEWLRPLLEAYASRGYISVAIDSRYHGERASNKTTYIDALKSAWRHEDTMPFIFDTVWDLIKLGDYLSAREDVDPSRIGITGESLGGMHAWFAAFADTRYSVVVPIIGVQGFRWAIDNNMWQARVDSIKPLFEEARINLGKSEIDTEVVEKVWDKIAPGMASQFDAPYSVPLIAPRPLLLLNGAEDPRCPIPGLQEPASRAAKAYEEAGSAEKFMFIAEPGIGHKMTANMVKEASDWFDRFL